MQSDETKTNLSDESEDASDVDTNETTTGVTGDANASTQADGELELGDVAEAFDANSLTATFAIAQSPLDPAQVLATVGIKVRGDLVAPGVLNEAQLLALQALLEPWMASARAGWAKLYAQRAQEQVRRKKDEADRKARNDKAAKEAGERATNKKMDKKAAGKVDPRKVVAPPPLFDVANTNPAEPAITAMPVTPTLVTGAVDMVPTVQHTLASAQDEPASLFDLN